MKEFFISRDQAPSENARRDGVRYDLGEAGHALSVTVSSVEERARNFFHRESLGLGKMWVNLDTSFCRDRVTGIIA